ncbi:phosphoribosylglycinamide formyltransferase-1 [Hydromonas duriensis]|uniref:Phosphoribosylglycinamide formyltransferase n=2 Tax=Hydromonas duriensis TaxID=1527608 RepID=A0A4R6Y782_9BURK|nr:phosphoribosylglycinamide formyltransferase-1 [Hydromonas duriensis]
MRALVRHVQNNNWEAQNIARVAAVISNKADAQGLVFAQEQGIATRVVQHQDFADREAFDAQLQHIIDEFAPDVVFLAGFMRILTPAFTTHYAKRMFNIHPSILPNFKGLHTHAAALTAGVKVHGATVHGVTAELDHGPIVLQSAVPVLADDDEHSLAQRVLATEHLIYPQVLDWWVNGLIDWNDNGIRVRDVRTQLYISDTI